MSIKSALVGAFLFLGAIGLAYYLQLKTGGEVYSKRDPASEQNIHLKNLKSDILKHEHKRGHIHTEKLRGPLKISISGPDHTDSLKNEIIPLILRLESDTDLTSVTVKWYLPEGVRLVSGVLEEEVSVQRGEPKELKIHVQPMDGRNHQIHVHASGPEGASRFVAATQYNTVFEPYLKAEAQDSLQKIHLDSESDTETTVLQ